MLTNTNISVKGTLKTASLFSNEYVKEHAKNACYAISEEHNGKYEVFIGFVGNSKTNQWEVFSFISVDSDTGKTEFLDYRLPSGLRMKNPLKRVRLS